MAPEKTSDNDTGIARRNVLRSMATAGAAAISLSSTAAADSNQRRLSKSEVNEATKEYKSVEAVQQLFSSYPEMITAVAEEGYIERPSVDEFDIVVDTDEWQTTQDNSGRYLAAFRALLIDGDVSPEIRIVREFEDGTLTILARPKDDVRWAVFSKSETEHDFFYKVGSMHPSSTQGVEATDTCSTCVPFNCSSGSCVYRSSCCCWDTCKNATCYTHVCG